MALLENPEWTVHQDMLNKVATTTIPGKVDFVKKLGPDMVIDYTKKSYDQIAEKFDFVFDTIGRYNLFFFLICLQFLYICCLW